MLLFRAASSRDAVSSAGSSNQQRENRGSDLIIGGAREMAELPVGLRPKVCDFFQAVSKSGDFRDRVVLENLRLSALTLCPGGVEQLRRAQKRQANLAAHRADRAISGA
jgi:hypothetical protein